jgi:hypothetical protein
MVSWRRRRGLPFVDRKNLKGGKKSVIADIEAFFLFMSLVRHCLSSVAKTGNAF